MKAHIKAAIYARVSSSEQNNENQKLRLTAFATEKGWQADIYEEVMSSRKTRPVKQELLAKLRAGVYDVLLVYKLDRWARSSTELILETKELLEKGITFISLSDNLDFSTASGKLHFQILSAFAEFERELIRERTIEGLKRAKSEGKQVGRPKGRKDTKKRRISGYIIREANKRKRDDENRGAMKSLVEYVKKNVANPSS